MAARPSIQLDQEFSSKFQNEIKADEVKKLNELSKLASSSAGLESTQRKIQNMSWKAILAQTLQTMVDILDDLTTGKPLQEVFSGSTGERPLFIGLVLLVFAVGIYLVDVTS